MINESTPSTASLERLLRVFLCHSSSDKKVARDLFWRLRSDGVDPWLDEESLIPGQDWQYEITRVLRASDVVLVCLSRQSITKSGYVQKEIQSALDIADQQPPGAIFVIPIKIEDCDLPDRLARWHWVSMLDPQWHDKLTKALKHRAEALGLQWQGPRMIDTGVKSYSTLIEAARRVELIFKSDLSRRGIRLVVEVDPQLVVNVPLDTMVLALVNLIANAQSALEEVGGMIKITAEDAGPTIDCHVSDTGPGIPQEIQPRLFKLGISTKNRGGGWGLLLVRQSLQAHGGEIFLETRDQKGAQFTLRLPKHRETSV